MQKPRSEYPRPQMVREEWMCLNGFWQFEIDPGDSGLERGLVERELSDEILVPFCPESELSGIGRTDYLNAVWYRRRVEIPEHWADKTVLLHFEAVDTDTTIWIDGQEVKRHRGGWTPISCVLTEEARAGAQHVVVVRARDDHRSWQPQGKQSRKFDNQGCHYTRTTGIWQSVWIEPVDPRGRLERPRITPDFEAGVFELVLPVIGRCASFHVEAELHDAEGVAAKARAGCGLNFMPRLRLEIPPDRRRAWSPENPFLYELKLRLVGPGGEAIDEVASYGGLRSVSIDGDRVLINGRSVFQRLVLDQGYWPDGIMTAPSDEALVRDIELSMAAGFNGARLHQKVFEQRFLYHADRVGYLVWSEMGDWCWSSASDEQKQPRAATVVAQWIEAVERDYNHPSIIGWCPLNESLDAKDDQIHVHDDVMLATFLASKAVDSTRPVLDTSGWTHRLNFADIYDVHDYEQDVETFASHHAGAAAGGGMVNDNPQRKWSSIPRNGQPYMVSEFGGIWWQPGAEGDSWGYGDRPSDEEEFYRRFEGLCSALLENPGVFGYCYTQLTDVFQETNGLFGFDRSAKFDLQRLRRIQQKPAAIERTSE